MQHKRHILHKEPGLCVSERLNSTGVALIVEADPLNGSDRATHARYALQDLRQSKQEAPIKGATITGRGGRVATHAADHDDSRQGGLGARRARRQAQGLRLGLARRAGRLGPHRRSRDGRA